MGAHKDRSFQRRSTETGKTFRDTCNIHLDSLGFALLGPEVVEIAGIEVDQVAVNTKGRKIYFEFKGGYEGDRPGLVRTDTTKKVLCNAFLLRECGLGPFVVITSVKPEEGSSSDRMIKLAGDVVFDLIGLGDTGDRRRLRKLLDMDDFSKAHLPRPATKVDIAEPGKHVSRPSPEDAALQIAWHSNPKVVDSGKKKQRKVLSKKEQKRCEQQLLLFDED